MGGGGEERVIVVAEERASLSLSDAPRRSASVKSQSDASVREGRSLAPPARMVRRPIWLLSLTGNSRLLKGASLYFTLNDVHGILASYLQGLF